MLTTKRLSIVPTTRCTLNCKLCSNHIPEFKNASDVPVEELINDIDTIFELFDEVKWLQFVGGEVFLHTELYKVYEYCHKYLKKFDKLIIETNATILPDNKHINVFRSYEQKIKILISDYGHFSYKRNEFVQLLEQNEIPFTIKKYYGDIQHFGGWIDNTGRHDYGETDDIVAAKAINCPQVKMQNMHCYRGKLHRCSNSLFLTELNLFEANKYDYLNMYDETLHIEEKREIIENFYCIPRKSCRYCVWKDAERLHRYNAAEQKGRGIL